MSDALFGSRTRGKPQVLHVIVAVLATVGLLLLQAGKLRQDTWWKWRDMTRYAQWLREEHAEAADFVRRHLSDDAWLAVHMDAGLLAYATRRSMRPAASDRKRGGAQVQ